MGSRPSFWPLVSGNVPGLALAVLTDFFELRLAGDAGYAKAIVEHAASGDVPVRVLAKPFTIQQLANALRVTLGDTA